MDIDRLIKVGTFLIALVGVPLFFYKEFLSDSRRKMDFTQGMIARFYDGDVYEARMRMLSKWNAPEIKKLMQESPSEVVVQKLVQDWMSVDEQFMKDLISVTYFYDSIGACVRTNQCSKEVVSSVLSDEVANFQEVYSRAISQTGKALFLEDFGSGLSES